jgi:hypothetical protein
LAKPVRCRINFAEVLATETAAYHLMQIAPERPFPDRTRDTFRLRRAIAGQMNTGKCESLTDIRVIPV